MKHFLLGFSLIWLVSNLAACASVPLDQRNRLADRLMTFDADRMGATVRAHMISPREGAIGGFSAVDAGGCSCK